MEISHVPSRISISDLSVNLSMGTATIQMEAVQQGIAGQNGDISLTTV